MIKSQLLQFDREFATPGLDVQQRDEAMNPSALAVFASGNDYCWPSQAAPNSGDHWVNAVDGGDDAIFAAGVGWDAATASFVYGPGSTDAVTLPASAFVLATNETQRLIMYGIRHDAQPTSGSGGIGIVGNFGATNDIATLQYGIYANRSAGGMGELLFEGPAAAFTKTIAATPVAGAYWHLGIRIAKITSGADVGKYLYEFYVNGVSIGTVTAAITSLPAATTARIGAMVGAQTDWNGRVLRAVADPLLDGISAAQTVANDYAEFLEEIAA